MSQQDRDALTKKIGAKLVECGLDDVKVKTVTEVICNIGGDKMEERMQCVVSKKLPSSQEDLAKKFKEAIKADLEGVEGVQIDVVAQLGVGEQYREIKDVIKVYAEDPAAACNLTHKEGEVWMIDFWATWCPPCQAPMAHNQTMLEKRAADWGDKLKIIGLSIDKDSETVKTHVTAKKWESVEHYHRAKSDCSDVYGVKGVPHVMLIDKKGKIVFKGHPATR